MSNRNFSIPGGLTLDNDSDIVHSKLAMRDKLMNVATTRNIRNNTMDVASHLGQDFMPTKRTNVHGRSALGNFNTPMRQIGGKKGSLPAPQILQLTSPRNSSKPTLLVDNS